jgi:hypothetical protein
LLRQFRILVVLLGCLHLCGGHWGVLQVCAWSKMLVDYTAQDGLLTGTRKTFDGEHPCAMCRKIAEEKKRDTKDNQVQLQTGLTLKECPVSQPPLLPAPRESLAKKSSLPEYRAWMPARATKPVLMPPIVIA